MCLTSKSSHSHVKSGLLNFDTNVLIELMLRSPRVHGNYVIDIVIIVFVEAHDENSYDERGLTVWQTGA
jgi:hypothetical protein